MAGPFGMEGKFASGRVHLEGVRSDEDGTGLAPGSVAFMGRGVLDVW